MWTWKTYDTGNDFIYLIYLIYLSGCTKTARNQNVTAGPYLFERGGAYQKKHRNRNLVVDGKRGLSLHVARFRG